LAVLKRKGLVKPGRRKKSLCTGAPVHHEKAGGQEDATSVYGYMYGYTGAV